LQPATEIVRFYGLLIELVGLDMLLVSNRFLLGRHIQLFRGAVVKLLGQIASLVGKIKTLLGLV
jgi:hypothetical protein